MSQNTGGDVPILDNIIQKTALVKQNMQALDLQVRSIGDQIPAVADLDAGRILSDSVGDWNQRFQLILNQLEEMNGRVIGVRNQLIQTGSDSVQTANS
ncbi:hypothetical protein [Thermocrispum municipale]|uniref:hypothetical protein n=1 Tax=Thermocrispum municipale TaxID=37926 RepID=UPI00042357F8|nr:hypothetical protein [Thermocrispum municipale]